MHIKKFKAVSISEALEKVKSELGDEAVIMHTAHKKIKDPITGRKIRVAEVVAAVDPDVSKESVKYETEPRYSPIIKRRKQTESEERVCYAPPQITEKKIMSSSAADTALPETDTGLKPEDISSLKEMLGQAIHALKEAETTSVTPSYSSSSFMVVNEVFQHLGIPAIMHQPLAIRLFKNEDNTLLTFRKALSWVRSYAARSVKTVSARNGSSKPCWQAFIGPTGVGKTTTLAKIAAIRKYVRKEKGVLVSVDTYRLGGVAQLERYAELIGVPIEKADDHKDLLRIFSKNRDKDFIFVDTTGRSPSSLEHKTEVGRLFDALPGLKANAFLCANYKAEDMKDLINVYRKLPVNGWIITKVDETRHYGDLFLPLIGYQIPVSYITNGQRVPEDIKEADSSMIMKMLFPEERTQVYNPAFINFSEGTNSDMSGESVKKMAMERI